MKTGKTPFIKWTGSKRKQAPYIVSQFPKEINTYYECFVGGASVLHELLNQISLGNITCKHIVCSDINNDLICVWNMLKDKNGEIEMYSNGIPRLDDDTLEKEMIHRINELLLIENDIDMHIIDEDCFNYDDCNGKYDVLSPIEIMNLQRILCGVGMNE